FQESRNIGDRLLAWGADLARPLAARLILNLRQPGCRALEVGRIAASALHDKILARFHAYHEFLRRAPSHGARAGLDGDKLEPAARVDAAIDVVMDLITAVEPCPVHVERVGIFHD